MEQKIPTAQLLENFPLAGNMDSLASLYRASAEIVVIDHKSVQNALVFDAFDDPRHDWSVPIDTISVQEVLSEGDKDGENLCPAVEGQHQVDLVDKVLDLILPGLQEQTIDVLAF